MASPLLWRIYTAILRGSGGVYSLPCVSRPESDGVVVVSTPDAGVLLAGDRVRSIDGVQVGGGRDRASTHDCTRLRGPGVCAVEVDRAGVTTMCPTGPARG